MHQRSPAHNRSLRCQAPAVGPSGRVRSPRCQAPGVRPSGRVRLVDALGGAGEVRAAVVEAHVEVASREADRGRRDASALRRLRRRSSPTRRSRLPPAPRLAPPRRRCRPGGRPARSFDSESERASRAAGRCAEGRPGRRRRRHADCRRSPSRNGCPRSPRGSPTVTSPMSCSTIPFDSSTAGTSSSPTLTTTRSACVRSASQRAAILVPLPEISAREPSGFQIAISTQSSPAASTSRMPSASPTSSRTRSGVRDSPSATR